MVQKGNLAITPLHRPGTSTDPGEVLGAGLWTGIKKVSPPKTAERSSYGIDTQLLDCFQCGCNLINSLEIAITGEHDCSFANIRDE